MPTRHPRHWITETPRVQAALDPLRQRGVKIDVADLIVRGAEERIRRLEEQAQQERKAPRGSID